jgi:hypothetical protein
MGGALWTAGVMERPCAVAQGIDINTQRPFPFAASGSRRRFRFCNNNHSSFRSKMAITKIMLHTAASQAKRLRI